jgi:hypothetical protein
MYYGTYFRIWRHTKIYQYLGIYSVLLKSLLKWYNQEDDKAWSYSTHWDDEQYASLRNIIIIIGSTALRGPWPSSEASASLSIQLLLLQISWQVFSRVGLSAPRPTPDYPGGPMFSVRFVSLSRLVPILKRQDLAFCTCMTYPYKRCPGAMTWTCMQLTW